MSDGGKKKKSEEWDLREKEWTEEMRRQTSGANRRPKKVKSNESGRKKFNPKNRFKLMLVCLGVLLFSVMVLLLTIADVNATYQSIISIFSAIISGVIFVVNYGKDISVSILNALTKNSLK